MWLDFAEDQARRSRQVFMKDCQEKLGRFPEFNDREVLSAHGIVRKSVGDRKARDEYARFEERRRAVKESEGQEEGHAYSGRLGPQGISAQRQL
ncbi:RhuM family protein [Aquisalimonas sp. 2447]|uniref:RhuM family protein n=1 Tax=Aquisalimonas sp. 2447 TaxID=2740807 RepID=UPI0020C29AE1|nr:RhuM family protein [Aquisalimonas sp. 2447]